MIEFLPQVFKSTVRFQFGEDLFYAAFRGRSRVVDFVEKRGRLVRSESLYPLDGDACGIIGIFKRRVLAGGLALGLDMIIKTAGYAEWFFRVVQRWLPWLVRKARGVWQLGSSGVTNIVEEILEWPAEEGTYEDALFLVSDVRGCAIGGLLLGARGIIGWGAVLGVWIVRGLDGVCLLGQALSGDAWRIGGRNGASIILWGEG